MNLLPSNTQVGTLLDTTVAVYYNLDAGSANEIDIVCVSVTRLRAVVQDVELMRIKKI